MIAKIVLKSDLWPGSEKCGFNPKFEDNDLESGCYRVSKLPPLSVKYVCPISHETKHPIMITKIVLKSVLWRGSESARYFCIFQFLCFSLHPNDHHGIHHIELKAGGQLWSGWNLSSPLWPGGWRIENPNSRLCKRCIFHVGLFAFYFENNSDVTYVTYKKERNSRKFQQFNNTKY